MKPDKLLLDLLEYTTPFGTEDSLYKYLPKKCRKDKTGNMFYSENKKNDILFISHLDTCGTKREKINLNYNKHIIQTDKKTILGADDKAGIWLLLNLINKGVKADYLFTVGEERGGIGASDFIAENDIEKYKKVISFDRRKFSSVITSMFTTCCSDEFALELSKALNYEPDKTGVFTDSKLFTPYCSEISNISVGYQNEHTVNETLNFNFLQSYLLPKLLKVNWNSLPVFRIPEPEYDYLPFDKKLFTV